MLLIPIGRDDAEIRRHAWVSYVIIALNVLMFIGVETAERSSRMASLDSQWREAVMYNVRHPYLETPPEMQAILRDDIVQYLQQSRASAAPPAPEVVETEQEELDALAAGAVDAYRDLPSVRFGYVPAEGGFSRLITSMFVHAGFLHLLGNLLFFYLSGPFIEDVFGRPLFAIVYTLGGIFASLTYAAQHPDGVVPLVGASGAIAAVMGAYLVRFLKSKVEFLFIPFLFRPLFNFRFFLPAFVVLPLWFVQQILEMESEAAGGSVAFSAHVGGFIFGFFAALMVKATRFEEKYVNPAVVQQTTWTMDERTTEAMAAVNAARGSGNMKALDTAAARLLYRYVEEKQDDLATDLIHELSHEPLPKFLSRAAAFAERARDRDWALTLYENMVSADPNSVAAVQSLVKIGSLLKAKGDTSAARETLTRARAHPACSAEWAPSIEAKIAQLGGAHDHGLRR